MSTLTGSTAGESQKHHPINKTAFAFGITIGIGFGLLATIALDNADKLSRTNKSVKALKTDVKSIKVEQLDDGLFQAIPFHDDRIVPDNILPNSLNLETMEAYTGP